MEITVRTKVNRPYLQVKEGFNEELFRSLNPPFPKVKLRRFDGCRKGDVVDMELQFGLFEQRWESHIVADDTTGSYFFFEDEGKLLPFFLKKWRHRHWVEKAGEEQSVIVDNVHYSTGSLFSDILLYPVMQAQFLYRRPIYKKWFA
ncbi:SRPBCC family protein [Nafulsella turpanensis]|uniref:SRPBCC family protein n=1 Tax=Nafulsella turpanensis TaxID=1265690 RepID=UPI00034A9BE5|nr:hypothetical protein [Nafulsella turpanensis]